MNMKIVFKEIERLRRNSEIIVVCLYFDSVRFVCPRGGHRRN